MRIAERASLLRKAITRGSAPTAVEQAGGNRRARPIRPRYQSQSIDSAAGPLAARRESLSELAYLQRRRFQRRIAQGGGRLRRTTSWRTSPSLRIVASSLCLGSGN